MPSTDIENPKINDNDTLAIVQGEPLRELPKDLYIPPDALEVILETFEGPLDLLLYLIKRQNLDILNIPVAKITEQYVAYIETMHFLKLELVAEYLLMASMLAEIKSRMLLPRPTNTESEEEDPRAELIRRLQEYERFKKAAEDLEQLPRMGRDIFVASVDAAVEVEKPLPQVDFKELMFALNEVFRRSELVARHQVQQEPLSIRARMSEILTTLKGDAFTDFISLFSPEEGRRGVIVTFMAMLELIRQSVIEVVQTEPFGRIHLKAVA